jgi:polyphosphate kinase
VEIAFPVLDSTLQTRIWAMLETQLSDSVKARRILADGRSVRVDRADPPLRSQDRLYELTASFC